MCNHARWSRERRAKSRGSQGQSAVDALFRLGAIYVKDAVL